MLKSSPRVWRPPRGLKLDLKRSSGVPSYLPLALWFFSRLKLNSRSKRSRHKQLGGPRSSTGHGAGSRNHHELKFVEVDDRDLLPVARWFLGRLAPAKSSESRTGAPALSARAAANAAYATATTLREFHCDSCKPHPCCEHSHSTHASESTAPLTHSLVGRGVRHARIGDRRYAARRVDSAMGRRT